MISTTNLSLLPGIEALRSLTQSLALLDAILCPDWLYRYYSFDRNWAEDIALASMCNGQGDHYFCLFSAGGALLKGFGHEAPMSPFRVDPPETWPGVLDDVPSQLAVHLADPALVREEMTFCIWRTYHDTAWHRGNIQFPDTDVSDGSAMLLSLLDGNPQSYQRWAEGYYERAVSLDVVAHVYGHQLLTDDVVRALNPDLSLEAIGPDIAEIGYGLP
jgi:hypothetical protein